jgi:hypothetical protein
MGKLFDSAIYGCLVGIAVYAVYDACVIIGEVYKLTH